MVDIPNKPEIDILQKEYERVASHIRLLESTNDKIVGFAVTIISAGFAYGIQNKIDVAFYFLPIALIGVFLYGTLQYYNLFWMGGYARAVEERINALAGHVVLYWETLIQTSRPRTNVNNVGLVLLYLSVLVGISGYSIYHVFSFAPRAVAMTNAAVVFGFAILLFFAARNMVGAYERSYRASKDSFD